MCLGPHKGAVGVVGPVWALQWDILLTVLGQSFFCRSFMFFLSCISCAFVRLFMCALWSPAWGGGWAGLLTLVCGVQLILWVLN